ncbi:hypothetical protein E2C01_010276 [Portunus trituberculatus]|uniref:Uncharacterized protein n=1 Tax=Portunus trituberculatus TaxID=210409 RepID=A0A5B7D7X8_PORTR|nr:hypothetical protein [Portunus trituberculatus]
MTPWGAEAQYSRGAQQEVAAEGEAGSRQHTFKMDSLDMLTAYVSPSHKTDHDNINIVQAETPADRPPPPFLPAPPTPPPRPRLGYVSYLAECGGSSYSGVCVVVAECKGAQVWCYAPVHPSPSFTLPHYDLRYAPGRRVTAHSHHTLTTTRSPHTPGAVLTLVCNARVQISEDSSVYFRVHHPLLTS